VSTQIQYRYFSIKPYGVLSTIEPEVN